MKSDGQSGRGPRPRTVPEVPAETRALGGIPRTPRKPAIMQDPVLVLNATFEPINVTAVRRAMVLMIKGVAQAEEIHNTQVHSASRALPVPSVIRLLAYRHIPQQTRALSRKNILLRDRNTCQFCGRTLPASDLTLDHVVPRSRGGTLLVGKLSCLLLPVQQLEGGPDPRGGGVCTGPPPPSFHPSYFETAYAPDRPQGRKMA